jgi:hypothetical protein
MWKWATRVFAVVACVLLVAYHVMDEAGMRSRAVWYALLVSFGLLIVADIGRRVASRHPDSTDHPASLRQALVPIILLVLPLGIVALIIIMAIMANREN